MTTQYNHILLVCVLLISFLSGCITPKSVDQYVPPTLTHSAITREIQGLKLSVDPIFNPERSKQVFETDALAKGIFPVFVRAENKDTNSSFLVQKTSFKLSSETNSKGGSSAMDTDIQSGTGGVVGSIGSAGMVVGPIFAPMLFAGTISVSNAMAEQYNFVQAELRDQSISPGQAVSGFIYFQIPKATPPLKGALIATIRETRTQKDLHLEIPFDY